MTEPIVPDPGTGALFGSAGDFQRAPTSEAQFAATQDLISRRYDIFHGYHYWSEEFPTGAEQSLAADGTILYLSWETEGVQWSSIIDGDYDELLAARARSIQLLEATVMLALQHEPEMHLSESGTAAEYVDAHHYVHDFFVNKGVENVVWVWNVTGAGEFFEIYNSLYPGDDVVDWVAWDPYNWFGCREDSPWRSFEEIVDPFYQWARQRYNKPLMVGEFGVVEHAEPGGPSKSGWFNDAIDAMTARPEIKAYVYFDVGSPRFCDWSIDSSPQAFAAFRRLANHPYLNTRP